MRNPRPSLPGRAAVLVALALALALVLDGCGSSGTGTNQQVRVVASFYPLQWLSERIGGPYVQVLNLTAPGVEPHDLELAPRDVAAVASADLVVYLSRLQPAVDSAVTQAPAAVGFDVTAAADLRPVAPGNGAGGPSAALDPHFWLDPARMASVAQAVAQRLAEVDPAHATEYRANAVTVRAALKRLDRAYQVGLRTCGSRALVTSHTAFGYLAQRYDLRPLGVAGLSPTAEPTPAQLAALTAFVRDNDVTTVFTEPLVSPAVARTLAVETGARVAVLDPVEGLLDGSGSADYLSLMRDNLDQLMTGLGCRR